MDLSHPINTVIPGGRGLVLAVLARTEESLTGRRIASLVGGLVGKTWVNELLTELVAAGIVNAQRQPPAVLYRLNREHLAAEGIIALATMRDRLLQELRRELRAWKPAPVTVWLFGSLARGEGGPTSDIDVAVVRPEPLEDDAQWAEQLTELAELIRRRTGNDASIIEYGEAELDELAAAKARIVADIRREGIHLAGRRSLVGRMAGLS
jgi:predicted nucleotidyltransferase